MAATRATGGRRGRRAARRAIAWLAALLPLGCGEPLPRAERIVLVTIDTLRADRVGAYGDDQAHTPTLDALAAAGTRFASAVAPAPTTLPSHTSLLTGLDPHQHGVRANGRFSLAAEVPTVAERMQAAGLGTAAFVAAVVLDSRYGLDRGFDVYDDDVGSEKSSPGALAVNARRGEVVVDAALAWIREQAPERFFLWVHLYDPHADYAPPPGWQERTGGDGYRGEIAYADAQVNRLLAGVQRRFGLEGLLTIVTSDHGESLGEHGERSHSHTLYDATQRVPLLLIGPGIPRGRVVEAPVRLIDVAPTLLARAGAPPLPDARGLDLTPLVYGDTGEEGRTAYLETLETQLGMGWSPLLGLRTRDRKYIRAPVPELYDLTADPGELENLAPGQPEQVAALDARLDALLAAHAYEAPAPVLSDAERAQLEALGYLGAGSPRRTDRPLGEVGGMNPRDHQHEVEILLRASGLIGKGYGAEGLRLLDTLQSRDGDLYQRLRATAALQTHDAAIARDAGERLVAMGLEGEGLYHRAMGALLAGDLSAARRDLERCVELDPSQARAHLGLGLVAESAGDLSQAARHYEDAHRANPDAVAAQAFLAAVHLREGRLEEADAILAGSAPRIGAHTQSVLRLAAAELLADRPERAQRWIEAGLREKPDHLSLLDARAELQMRAGRFAEAVDTRRRLREIDPRNPRQQSELAMALLRAGGASDEALSLAEDAVRLQPDATTLAALATVQLVRGEASQALEAADQGLAGAPPQARSQLLYVRAAALAELGRTGEARVALAALAQEPQPLGPPFADRADALARRLQ